MIFIESCPVAVWYVLSVEVHFETAQNSTFFGNVKTCKSFTMEGINITKVTNSIRNKEELPEEWKESITATVKRGDKTDCSNYRGMSLLPAMYKILSNILLSRLTPYTEEIIGDHQCVL
jgi:hypothetical protein